jgi:hypothetical protein
MVSALPKRSGAVTTCRLGAAPAAARAPPAYPVGPCSPDDLSCSCMCTVIESYRHF